jgi:hypothetical protein
MFQFWSESFDFGSQTFQLKSQSFQSRSQTFQEFIETFQKNTETVQELIENLGNFPQKWVKMTHFEVLDIFERAIYIEYARGGNATPKHYFKCRRHKIVQ